jgi:beta-N-acetylhexosaminidase
MRSVRILAITVFVVWQAAGAGMHGAHAQGEQSRPGAILSTPSAAEPAVAIAPRRQAAAEAAVVEADLAEKIGQMILVGFTGKDPADPGFARVRAQIKSGEIGGVLYLGRNLKDRTAIRRMNAGLTSAAPAHVPPLIAIDQEGGQVQRLEGRHGFPQTLSAKGMARTATPAEATTAYGVLAESLSDWGFNLNLGPVLDLDSNPRNPIIGRLERSYSADPEIVGRYGTAFVEAHKRYGVLTALKHFPGHGSSRTDSHKGTVDVSNTWSPSELDPFRQLISHGQADLIMTAHVHNDRLQDAGESLPVSLSVSAVSGVLRGELGFDGVIISDDLQMDAIRRNYTLEQTVVQAVNAGTDLLVFANDKHPDPDLPEKVASILVAAAESDPVLASKIEASYQRVVALKTRLTAQPVAKPQTPPAPDTVAAAPADRPVLTPEDVDASLRSVRLVLPAGLAL